jgi:hypothetical protein
MLDPDSQNIADPHAFAAVEGEAGQMLVENHDSRASLAPNSKKHRATLQVKSRRHMRDSGNGHKSPATHEFSAAPATNSKKRAKPSLKPKEAEREGEAGPLNIDTRIASASLANTLAEIREQWRRRQAWHRAEKSLTLQAKALCRRLAIEGDKTEADKIYKAALGKGHHEMATFALGAMVPLVEARNSIKKHRTLVEKRLADLAKDLPAASFVEGVKGAGLGGLASLIGETGDLSNYANPAKVWKRLGFAPYQGHAGSTWKRDSWRPRSLTKDEWVENPFSGSRYSVAQQIALAIFKQQWTGAAKTESGEGEPSGPYGEIYAARRKHTATTHPDWTKAHANADALRIMMKRFLRDLWVAWRQATAICAPNSNGSVPPPE